MLLDQVWKDLGAGGRPWVGGGEAPYRKEPVVHCAPRNPCPFFSYDDNLMMMNMIVVIHHCDDN